MNRGQQRKLRESDIQKAILDYCAYHPNLVAWRNPTTGVWDASRKIFRTAAPGSKGAPDIIGIIKPWGLFLGCEVKTPARRKAITPEQVAFLERICKGGGLGFLACSLDEFKEAVFEFIHSRVYCQPKSQ